MHLRLPNQSGRVFKVLKRLGFQEVYTQFGIFNTSVSYYRLILHPG